MVDLEDKERMNCPLTYLMENSQEHWKAISSSNILPIKYSKNLLYSILLILANINSLDLISPWW